MKNKLPKILSLLIAFVMLGGCVVSYAVEFVPDGQKYIIDGNAGDVSSNMLSLDVSGVGGSVHLSYIITNDNGDFSYTFMLPEGTEPGKYSVRITDADRGEIFSCDFMHADDEKKAQLIEALNTADDAETAKLALEECVMFSMYAYPTGFELSKAAVNEIYEKIAETSGFATDNYADKLGEIFAVASLKYANADYVDKVIDEYSKFYAFEREKYYSLYKDSDDADAVNQMFLKNEFDDLEQIRTVFNEIAVLHRMYKEESPGGVVRIIDSYKDVFPENVTGLSESEKLKLGTKVLGKQVNTMAELEAEVNSVLNDNKKDNESSGNGGSGRGSSKTSGYSAGVADIVIAENNEIRTSEPDFADMRDAEWAREAVFVLSDKKILNGYTDGDFKPNNPVSREEFVKIIVCAFGLQTGQAENEFSDVPDGHWAEAYICTARKNGMINGIGGNEFGLGQNISRQDMAVIIYNALQKNGISVMSEEDSIFSDMADTAEYATEAVKALKSSGITDGYADGSFRPLGTATRAETAQLIYNVLIYCGEI